MLIQYDDAASSWYDCDHVASIQTAIDRVCDGGTVNVHPGTYVEDIMINVEDMTLTSTGATEDTKINGAPGGTSDVVTISAGNVTIDGFYITACISGASDGIDVRSDYNTISNKNDIYIKVITSLKFKAIKTEFQLFFVKFDIKLGINWEKSLFKMRSIEFIRIKWEYVE